MLMPSRLVVELSISVVAASSTFFVLLLKWLIFPFPGRGNFVAEEEEVEVMGVVVEVD